MSEFKFACPVCGQHITADSASSGTQPDCPTCFRTIVVPQAPASDSKLILSATQAGKQRPGATGGADLGPLPKPRGGLSLAGAVVLLILTGGALAIYSLRPQFSKLVHWGGQAFQDPPPPAEPAAPPAPPAPAPPPSPYPVPTNVHWTLDIHRAVIPEQRAAGRIHGGGFLCEQASLTGGSLSLRQGRGWPPDLAVAVVLSAQRSEDLGGKTILIHPSRPPPAPRVILRWKNERSEGEQQDITSGYALKVSFDRAATGRISGKIFIALPDESKSVVAGTFDAEIKPPRQRKQGSK